MSNIDFQNGFVCGMATKGLTRSGEYYKPIIWNDCGEYSYFYIDFKKSMEFFTLGMFNESIIVHDSEQLPVKGIENISPSVYKITCDIRDKTRGITILNKKTSLLSFSGGEKLPVFSVHVFVEGQEKYERLKYIYDKCNFSELGYLDLYIESDYDIDISSTRFDVPISESGTITTIYLHGDDNVNVILT
jgi:hypothetical protein